MNQQTPQNNIVAQNGQAPLPDFSFQGKPIQVTCPNCHQTGLSKVDAKKGMLQWICMHCNIEN